MVSQKCATANHRGNYGDTVLFLEILISTLLSIGVSVHFLRLIIYKLGPNRWSTITSWLLTKALIVLIVNQWGRWFVGYRLNYCVNLIISANELHLHG